jgi:hypothetical protein
VAASAIVDGFEPVHRRRRARPPAARGRRAPRRRHRAGAAPRGRPAPAGGRSGRCVRPPRWRGCRRRARACARLYRGSGGGVHLGDPGARCPGRPARRARPPACAPAQGAGTTGGGHTAAVPVGLRR